MNKTNKIIVSIALTLVLCTGAALLAQAFFQAFNQNASGTVTVTPPANTENDNVYIEVDTEAKLIAATKDPQYNASGDQSVTATRKIILLTADVTLNSDLLITRDCHIDLGGKTLDTGDYAVTVYHTYTGTFIITNGNLIGTLNVNTPNAAVLVDSSVNTADTTVLTQNVEAISPAAVCKAALSMVCAHLSNNLDHGIYGLLGYNETKCTLPNYSEYFGCEHTGCCFSVGTPDLPYWFFGYDELKITYTTASANGVDTLTASVAYGTATDSQGFIIHNISATDYENLAKAAQAILLKQLQPYKKTLEDNSKIYEFRTAILLPDTISIGSVDVPMTYTATQGSVTDNLYAPAEKGSLEIGCGPFVEDGEIYKQSIPTNGTVTELLDSVYTKANRVIKELFGSEIVIEKDGTSYIPQTWTDDHESIPSAKLYGVKDIVYARSNDTNDFYYLTEPTKENPTWTLGVKDGKNPEQYLDKVFLQATVTIDDNGKEEKIVFNIPIRCQEVATGGDTVSQFLPYYHYFNEIFTQRTDGNYTYNTFYMPTKYTDGSPAIAFYLVDVNNVAGGGAYKFYEFNDTNAIAINKILGVAETEDRYINVSHPQTGTDADNKPIYDETRWQFTIDPEKIGRTDRTLVFGYWYQFEGESGKLFENLKTPANGKYTVLTIPGVLNTTADVPDATLYEKLFKIYHTEAYDSETNTWSYTYKTDYILTSRLVQAVDETQLNFKDNTAITNFKGIEYLSGATGINLQNSGIDEDDLALIAKMTNLEYLNLANNGLSDGQDFNVNTDLVGQLTTLTKLKKLHLENQTYGSGENAYIPNPNVIYDFTALQEFEVLKEVFTYGNTPTYTAFQNSGQILQAIGNLLTNVLRQVYGSEGATNIAAYSVLHANNVMVYHKNATTPFAPSGSTSNNYSAFTNIEYQDKLVENANIGLVYQNLSTNPAAYGFEYKPERTIVTYDTAGNKTTGTFYNEVRFVPILKTYYVLDDDGNKIPVLDNDKNPVMDDEGNPVYETQVETAANATEFALVYTDYVYVVPESGDFWASLLGTTDPLAFSYTVQFKFSVTRVDANGNPLPEKQYVDP